ncbi:MAG: twin-arginine translocase subunit TatC [Gammaproteobacteria bacterium]|nr:twin-arginine translocase subunit TatC [Gammaproteobacteria bacterium]
MTSEDQANSDATPPLISHLTELRDRLIRAIGVTLLIFVGLVPFASQLFTFMAGPLFAHLPENSSMIATQVATPFLTPFKLAFMLALFAAMPVWLHQMWAFVAPGLYKQERRFAVPLIISSLLLFYAGVAFAYFVVFPLVFGFFTSSAPDGVTVMTDISHYLDFIMTLFFAFGLAFEIPIATVLVVWAGITTPAALSAKRPYILIGVFVIGMLLTPPDIISQSLLAVPMYLLFELGILFARMLVPRAKEVEQQKLDDVSS